MRKVCAFWVSLPFVPGLVRSSTSPVLFQVRRHMISRVTRTLRRYCSEDLSRIENYQEAVNDKEHKWHCHHRLEVQGQFRNSKELLERCGMYWNRPASELIFLRADEHRILHNTGMHHSDETKRRIAEKQMGTSRGCPRGSETRRKISDSLTNRQDLSTPVEMSRMPDGFTKVFPSMREAARWLRENGYPNANTGRVSECANGHRATAYNATWRYA